MTDNEIFDKLVDIIHETMPKTVNEEINPSTVINRDIGIDSMNFILVVCKIEVAFGIEIPDEKWMNLSTMQDIIDMIKELMKEQIK